MEAWHENATWDLMTNKEKIKGKTARFLWRQLLTVLLVVTACFLSKSKSSEFLCFSVIRQWVYAEWYGVYVSLYGVQTEPRWSWTANLKQCTVNPASVKRDRKLIDLRGIPINWFKNQLCSSIRLSRLWVLARLWGLRRTRLPNASGAPMRTSFAGDIRQWQGELFCAHPKRAAHEEPLYFAWLIG